MGKITVQDLYGGLFNNEDIKIYAYIYSDKLNS